MQVLVGPLLDLDYFGVCVESCIPSSVNGFEHCIAGLGVSVKGLASEDRYNLHVVVLLLDFVLELYSHGFSCPFFALIETG